MTLIEYVMVKALLAAMDRGREEGTLVGRFIGTGPAEVGRFMDHTYWELVDALVDAEEHAAFEQACLEECSGERVGSRTLAWLPERFRWTTHNLVAHPLSEVLYQLGFKELSNEVHDRTIPAHTAGKGRG